MIFVFKTSVKSRTQLEKLKPHIKSALPNVKWNFDLEDIDKILRVDSEKEVNSMIIDLLNSHSFSCEELE